MKEIEINGEIYVPKESRKPLELGDYVVVRTESAGVHAGYLDESDHEFNSHGVKLLNSRRLWSWQGAATLSQVAGSGIQKPDECRFPEVLPEIVIFGVIEIIPTSDIARDIIQGVPVWKE